MPDAKKPIAGRSLIESNPELFDDQDCRVGCAYPESQIDEVTPSRIKALIAERRAAEAALAAPKDRTKGNDSSSV